MSNSTRERHGEVTEHEAGLTSETRPALLGRSVDTSEYGRLDTFPADPAQTWVELSGDELTALCPMVDAVQPDFYRWSVRYRPRGRCVETKSLKLYLLTFRDEQIFAEHLAPRIARDLAAALDTEVTVRLTQSRRGGIETAVEAVAGNVMGTLDAEAVRPQLNRGAGLS